VSRTALICDDTMFMRMVIRRALETSGYVVVGEAETGMEAVAKYSTLRPDFVTMDVVMPDQGGIEAVRQIRAIDPDACIIVCSALGQERLVGEARDAGAVDFLMKPFQGDVLIAAVARALHQRPARAGFATKDSGVS
jgi:two-component system chemotaxis response regulator CheY